MNSTIAANKPSTNPTAFFVLTFALSLPFYAIVALVPQEMALMMVLTIALAPITAALILACRDNRSDGVRRLLRRSFDYKRITRRLWYVPIFCLMPVIFILASGLVKAIGEPVPDPLLPVAAAPVAFLVFFLFALFEEVGWMGYAFDPMQDRWNALIASIILGIIWGMWHIPAYILTGQAALWIAGQVIALVAIRTLIVWLYNGTGKSVFAVILFHAVYNVCTMMITSFYTPVGHLITSAFIVVTAVIVAFLMSRKQ